MIFITVKCSRIVDLPCSYDLHYSWNSIYPSTGTDVGILTQVACDVPLWATIGGQDVDRLPSASTCYNTLKVTKHNSIVEGIDISRSICVFLNLFLIKSWFITYMLSILFYLTFFFPSCQHTSDRVLWGTSYFTLSLQTLDLNFPKVQSFLWITVLDCSFLWIFLAPCKFICKSCRERMTPLHQKNNKELQNFCDSYLV